MVTLTEEILNGKLFYPVYYTPEITFCRSAMVAVSYLVHHDFLLQNATTILLQNASGCSLQNTTVVIKCVVYYKMRLYQLKEFLS